MGCASSKQESEPSSTKLFTAQEDNSPHNRVSTRRRQSVNDLNSGQQAAISSLFHENRDGETPDGQTDAAQVGKTMTKAGLRKVLFDVNDELFDFLWLLFDETGKGEVNSDDFVMAMALMTSDIGSSTEAQLEAAFCMFDTNKSGSLSCNEFKAMVQSTVNLNLHHLLSSEAGKAAFESQLAKEFSDENLQFWQATRSFKALPAAERDARARAIAAEYVQDESTKQVNLPSKIRLDLLKYIKAGASDTPPDIDIFDPAAEEIFKLMEKDTFARFKSDDNATQELLDRFFAAVEIGPDGQITYAAFERWALTEPTVLIMFTTLRSSIKKLIADRTAARGDDAATEPTNAGPIAEADMTA